MGALTSAPELQIVLTPQSLTKAIQIFNSKLPPASIGDVDQELYQSVRTINAQFVRSNLYQTREDGETFLSPVLVRIWTNPNFQANYASMYRYWREMLQLITKANTVLVKVMIWRLLGQLTNLLICLSVDRVFNVLNNISVVALCQQTKKVLATTQNPLEEQPRKTFINRLSREQAQDLYKIILIILSNFINLKTSAISRSEATLELVDRFASSCFVVFCKLYFHQQHHRDIRKRAIKVNNEAHLENLSYFLGTSFEQKNSSLFDVAVIFAISLIYGNKTNSQVNSLPSHLFKTLSTSDNNNIFNFILQTTLLALTYHKQEGAFVVRFDINRHNATRLVHYLVEYDLVKFNSLSTSYLQNICAHTKPHQVQRIYLESMIESSLKYKQNQSLRKFLQPLKKPFDLVLSNTEITLKCPDLLTEMTSQQDYLVQQMPVLYYDYCLEIILHRQKSTKYKDKVFWKRFLDAKRDNKITC